MRRRVQNFLLAIIFGYQGLAFAQQFAHGFRPFYTVPTRVPFSWDMFAVEIERCTVQFSPAIRVGATRITHLSDATPGFEWDIVGDTQKQYTRFVTSQCRIPASSQASCQATGTHASATLRCALVIDGHARIERQVLPCDN